MKVSEIARYWAAKELTATARDGESETLDAPFGCPGFTLRLAASRPRGPSVHAMGEPTPLREVKTARDLTSGTWSREGNRTTVCFDLPKGRTTLEA